MNNFKTIIRHSFIVEIFKFYKLIFVLNNKFEQLRVTIFKIENEKNEIYYFKIPLLSVIS